MMETSNQLPARAENSIRYFEVFDRPKPREIMIIDGALQLALLLVLVLYDS
jgi:hypothetical protein